MTIVVAIGSVVVLGVAVGLPLWRVRREVRLIRRDLRATQQQVEIQRLVMDEAEVQQIPRRRHLRALPIMIPIFAVVDWAREYPGPAAASAAAASAAVLSVLVPAGSPPDHAMPAPPPPPVVGTRSAGQTFPSETVQPPPASTTSTSATTTTTEPIAPVALITTSDLPPADTSPPPSLPSMGPPAGSQPPAPPAEACTVRVQVRRLLNVCVGLTGPPSAAPVVS